MQNILETYEVNFDGLIGPTHNYSGLAYGNLASLSSKYFISSPKQAALQGLTKMRLLHSLGIKQGFIPPQERPDIIALRKAGFSGSVEQVIDQAWQKEKDLFLNCCSASSMWCANAATVSPSSDARDGKVHISASNLKTHPHRANESEQTWKFLNEIFFNDCFVVHEPLSEDLLLDEGAANHMRLTSSHDCNAINIFVYGKDEANQRFPSRQSFEASKQIAKHHKLNKKHTIFIRQNPDVTNMGVFHNDVIATSNENVLFVHERAFSDSGKAIVKVNSSYKKLTKQELIIIEIHENQFRVEEAIQSYLFNSQIVTLPTGGMSMIAPFESREGRPRSIIDEVIKGDNPIRNVYFVQLNQSMANGGGPACLRLRVVCNSEELNNIHQGYLLDDEKFDVLEDWVDQYYRDELNLDELNKPELLNESQKALDALTKMLKLGSIYSFQ